MLNEYKYHLFYQYYINYHDLLIKYPYYLKQVFDFL